MRFEYVEKVEKYDRLKKEILAAGYRIIPSSPSEGDAILLAQRDNSAYFVVGKRDYSGWFVCVHGPVYYLVPEEARVAELCIRLLEQPYHGEVGWPKLDSGLQAQFTLTQVDAVTWSSMEHNYNSQRWEANGWQELSESETSAAWSEFDRWANLVLPSLAINTLDIAWLYELPVSELDRIEQFFTLEVLKALRKATQPEEKLLVLQKNYSALAFSPHRHTGKIFREYWPVPILPDRDNHYFLSKDFRIAILSEWTEMRIRVVGLENISFPQRSQ